MHIHEHTLKIFQPQKDGWLAQMVKNIHAFFGTQNLLLSSQLKANGSYSKSDKSNPHLYDNIRTLF